MIPKFRCFDKNTKTMHEVVAIDFKDWRVYYEAYGLRSYWNKNVALMQSTGLHDEQGVEIFQGDVVKIVYDGEPFTGVVVYDLGEADFKATNGHEDYGNNFQCLTVGESIEVIGNVHQHPELLEDV